MDSANPVILAEASPVKIDDLTDYNIREPDNNDNPRDEETHMGNHERLLGGEISHHFDSYQKEPHHTFNHFDYQTTVQRAEQDLIHVLKNRIGALTQKLRDRDKLVVVMDRKMRHLENTIKDHLSTISQKDEALSEISSQFQELLKANDDLISKVEEVRDKGLKEVDEVKEKLRVRVLEVKDLREKVKNSKNDVKFYKKGYLEEIDGYKKDLKDRQGLINSLIEKAKKEKKELEDTLSESYERTLRDLKEENTTKVQQMKENLLKEIRMAKESEETKSKTIIALEKKVFMLETEAENKKITIESLERRNKALTEEVNRNSNEEFKKVLSMKMELQKELAIKSHMLMEKEKEAGRVRGKLESLKKKFTLNLTKMQQEYEEKIVGMVLEYRREIEEAKQGRKKAQDSVRALKQDMARLAESVKLKEQKLRLAGEQLERSAKQQVADFEEQLHRLRNEVEVVTAKFNEAEVRGTHKAAELEEEFNKNSNLRIQILDLQKENQILIDQLVSLKQQEKSKQLREAYKGKEIAEEDNQEEAHLNGGGGDGAREEKSKLFSDDQGDPTPMQSDMFRNLGLSGMVQSKELLNSALKKRYNERLKTSSHQEALEEENRVLKELIDEMRQDMERVKEDFQQGYEKIKYLEQQNTEMSQKERELRMTAMELREQLSQAKTREEMTIEEKKHLEHEKEELEDALAEMEEQLRVKEKELLRQKERMLEVDQLRDQREELIRTLSKTRAKMLKYKDACEGMQQLERVDEILGEVELMKVEIGDLREDLAAKNKECERLRKNLARYIYKKPKKVKGKKKDGEGVRRSSTIGGVGGSGVPMVRNFNIKDDDEYARILEKEGGGGGGGSGGSDDDAEEEE